MVLRTKRRSLLQDRAHDASLTSGQPRYLHFHAKIFEAFAVVVLRVTQALDIEEVNLRTVDRERPPMPGTLVKDQSLQRFQEEGFDLFGICGIAKRASWRGNRDHRSALEY